MEEEKERLSELEGMRGHKENMVPESTKQRSHGLTETEVASIVPFGVYTRSSA